jgi:S1-C subfamily serine protease
MADSFAVDKVDEKSTSADPKQFDAWHIFAQGAPSVVGVDTATGFFVSSGEPHSCEVATSRHVTNADTADVTTINGEKYVGRAELLDGPNEVSIYKLDGVADPSKTCREVTIEKSLPSIGEPVLSIGADDVYNKFVNAQHPDFITGIVTGNSKTAGQFWGDFSWPVRAINRMRDGVRDESFAMPLLVIKGEIHNGFSGGPWLNQNGRLVGLNYAGRGGSSFPQTTEFLQKDLDLIKARKAAGGDLSAPIRVE